MNGLEKIAEQIRMQARQEADAVIQAAQQEAEALVAKARETGEKEAAQLLEQAEIARENERARALAAAEADERRSMLHEKQRRIAQVIEEALKKLETLPDDEYFALMLHLVEQYCLPEAGELVFSETDRQRMPADFPVQLQNIAQKCGGTLQVSAQTRPLSNGFVLIYGGIEQNCTLRALIDAKREQLQDLVNRVLFTG